MKKLKESAESIRLKQQCAEMGIDNLIWDSMTIQSGKRKYQFVTTCNCGKRDSCIPYEGRWYCTYCNAYRNSDYD